MKSSNGSEVSVHNCCHDTADISADPFLIVTTDSPNKQWELAPWTVEHIGEEVADVLVYSTRLADLCCVDLGAAVAAQRGSREAPDCSVAVDASTPWSEHTLGGISRARKGAEHCGDVPIARIRSTLFQMQSSLGAMCAVFSTDGYDNIDNMTLQDKTKIASCLGGIIIALGDICSDVGISLSGSVTDKIQKNIMKYPKDIVKGSSAKYTEYKINNSTSAVHRKSALMKLVLCVSAFAVAGLLMGRSSNMK